MYRVKFTDLGVKDYQETWEWQQALQDKLIRSKTAGTGPGSFPALIFVEHPHVYTLGKSGKAENLLINPEFLAAIGAHFYRTDRGGDITYHGPGQIVGYPLLDLDVLGFGIKQYIALLEESIIRTLGFFGIQAGRLPAATGVWLPPGETLPGRKICAMGVKVSRGVTMHGFALNVTTNLQYFSYIHPCGFTDKGVTSMEKELGFKPDLAEVKKVLLENLCELFGLELF